MSGVGVLAPRAALATQGAELYETQAYFYGRFEARLRFAPGEGVVSSFFLWRDGSSSTTSWNELDYEKINASCKLTTNIWTGKGTQSSQTNTTNFDVCADYHTYAFEWTPDYIAWLIDGTQIRKVTGANVAEYTQNASQGMSMHFNIWAGDASFGGTLSPSTLPVHQFLSWVQYSSYASGAFQVQWREDFTGASLPDGWATGTWSSPYNLSTHNPANVTFANGIAVLSMTADTATGFSGSPPADPAGGDGAAGGGSGRGGTSGGAGTSGAGGTGMGTGSGGAIGAAGRGAGGTASSGSGGMSATGSGGSGPAAGSGGSGTGGTGGTGGAGGTGMSAASGGTSGSASGGSQGAGSGGSTGSGSGGQAPDGSGGAVGSGGASATGGASASGGSSASGGAPSHGGSGGTGTGGSGTSPPAGNGGGGSCDVGSSTGPTSIAALLLLLGMFGVGVRARRRESLRRP